MRLVEYRDNYQPGAWTSTAEAAGTPSAVDRAFTIDGPSVPDFGRGLT